MNAKLAVAFLCFIAIAALWQEVTGRGRRRREAVPWMVVAWGEDKHVEERRAAAKYAKYYMDVKTRHNHEERRAAAKYAKYYMDVKTRNHNHNAPKRVRSDRTENDRFEEWLERKNFTEKEKKEERNKHYSEGPHALDPANDPFYLAPHNICETDEECYYTEDCTMGLCMPVQPLYLKK